MNSYQLQISLALVLSLCQFSTRAHEADPFLALALQEVLELEITSVSKKPQTLSRAAAAVFVITGDDIRRSGAQNLPDALRLAPGIQVAQVSANAWAVSARGPNGRFANKLLVMIDGRVVYSPMFSGVTWAAQDTVLADIERIEVIRGPGASLWGANAVNGVINIITKSAAATQGVLIDTRIGSVSKGQVSMRYGSQLGDSGFWRLYGKSFENKASTLADGFGKGMDGWRQQRLGGRVDLNPTARDAITVQGEIQQGTYGESAVLNSKQPVGSSLQGTQQANTAGHLLARWQHDLDHLNAWTVQAYFDRSYLDWPAHAAVQMNILDIDTQYRHRSIDGHDLVLGASFRQTKDTVQESSTGLPANIVPYENFSLTHQRTRMWSVLAQDDIRLVPDKLTLTLGSKFEKYEHENLKPLPNVRLMWTPKDNQTIWTSASKAIRTPSRIDNNGTISTLLPSDYQRNGQAMARPTFIELTGKTSSEQLWAYEVGWKQSLAPGLTLDTSVYYNDYTQLKSGSFDLNSLRCQAGNGASAMPMGLPLLQCMTPAPSTPDQYLVVPINLANDFTGHSQGIEAWLDWQASKQQRFQASLTRFGMKLKPKTETTVGFESPTSSPKWSGSLRWSYTPNKRTETDVVVRHVGALQNILFVIGQSVPSYNALDLRWAWHSSPEVQWSVTGRNLLMSRHVEFISEASDVARTLMGPSLTLGLRIQY